MVGKSTLKWVVGVAAALLLAYLPANCIDWNATQRAADAAARAQVAVERALDAERAAEALRAARDSSKAAADSLAGENARLRARLAAARAAVPPRPEPVPGCEACEVRSAALEVVIASQDSLITAQGAEIGALRVGLQHAEAEASLMGRTVAQLRVELESRTAVRPVVKSRGIPLPDLTIGYAGVIVSRGDRPAVVHGPGVSLGYRLPLPRIF